MIIAIAKNISRDDKQKTSDMLVPALRKSETITKYIEGFSKRTPIAKEIKTPIAKEIKEKRCTVCGKNILVPFDAIRIECPDCGTKLKITPKSS